MTWRMRQAISDEIRKYYHEFETIRYFILYSLNIVKLILVRKQYSKSFYLRINHKKKDQFTGHYFISKKKNVFLCIVNLTSCSSGW